jgi:hypothetical protein
MRAATGSVHLLALGGEVGDEVVAGPGAVDVPSPVEDLHEAHAALDEAAREEAVVGDDCLPGAVPYISWTSGGSLEMSMTSGTETCMRNASSYWLMRVSVSSSPKYAACVLVEIAERVEARAGRRGPCRADRRHRAPGRRRCGTARLGRRWGGSRTRTRSCRASGWRPPLTRTTKRGEIGVVRAQAVGRPRAHGGAFGARRAGVEEELRGRVVELVGEHRVDERDLIADGLEVGEQLGGCDAGLAVRRELVRRAEDGGVPLDEGEAFHLEEGIGAGLAV